MHNHDVSSILADTSERFSVMRKLESTTYSCDDYLSCSFQAESLTAEIDSKDYNSIAETINHKNDVSMVNNCLNEAWREKICEWSYQVVDHFDLSRETASISISFLDRYLCTQRNVNKKLFQLAAMTTLHIASKLNEPNYKVVPMSSLTELSRGFFTIDHIRSMEGKILNALDWHMHPPTTLAFVRQILLLLESSPSFGISPEVIHTISQTAQFLTELSVCDYFFVPRKSSDIATACVLTAMETIDETSLSSSARAGFIHLISLVAGIDCTSFKVLDCQDRIKDMYQQSGYHQTTVENDQIHERKRQKNNSPICVSEYERHE